MNLLLAAILPSSNFLPFSKIYNINPIQHYNINPIKHLLLIAILPAVILNLFLKFIIVIIVWKGIQSRSETNRSGAKGLFFYYPRLLYCPDQMLVMMLLSHNQVLSFKIFRPRVPFGA